MRIARCNRKIAGYLRQIDRMREAIDAQVLLKTELTKLVAENKENKAVVAAVKRTNIKILKEEYVANYAIKHQMFVQDWGTEIQNKTSTEIWNTVYGGIWRPVDILVEEAVARSIYDALTLNFMLT